MRNHKRKSKKKTHAVPNITLFGDLARLLYIISRLPPSFWCLLSDWRDFLDGLFDLSDLLHFLLSLFKK